MPKNATRIVIVVEHELSRQSLRALLQSKPDFKVVGEATDGPEAVAIARRSKADLLLLDISFSITGGFDLLQRVVRSDPEMRVLLLSPPLNKAQTVRAIELGARGVVLKTSSSDLLIEAIQKIRRGEYWVSNESLSNLIEAIKAGPASKRAAQNKYGLTSRESDMVVAVLDGHSNPEIATRFGLSEQTVKHHLSHIFDKLGVYSRLELALFAVNHRILDTSIPDSEG
jgi:two-component system, NarL family, nitrate/nitrite response regulator NarL